MTVDGFHHIVRSPSANSHYLRIGDAETMQITRHKMPAVVEPHGRESISAQNKEVKFFQHFCQMRLTLTLSYDTL